MQYRKLKLGALLLLGFGISELRAQETISAAGANASSNEGSLSYSVGQVVYKTHMGINGSVAEGVQQPNENLIVSSELLRTIDETISTYPNPVEENLTIHIEDAKQRNLSYRLADVLGETYNNTPIDNEYTQIDMEGLRAGSYILTILDQNKTLKSIAIIKY